MTGQAVVGALPDDGYGQMIRCGFDRLAERLADPRSRSHPGDGVVVTSRTLLGTRTPRGMSGRRDSRAAITIPSHHTG